MPPTPTPRPHRPQVPVQVARGGGAGRTRTATETAPPTAAARGRHRTPDTGALPEPEGADRIDGPRTPLVPSRHTAPSRGTTPARTTAPSRATTPSATTTPSRHIPPRQHPGSASRGAPGVPADGCPASGHDDAVTDLVAGPARRGGAGGPDAPATGPVPGLVGLALGVLALLGAVLAAAAPGVVAPVVGPLGTSPSAMAVLVAAGLLATACAGVGAGRRRTARVAAVTGIVVGLAAVAAAVVPLLALSL